MSEPTGYGPDYYKSESELRAQLAAKDARFEETDKFCYDLAQRNLALRKELAEAKAALTRTQDASLWWDQYNLEVRKHADTKAALEAANARIAALEAVGNRLGDAAVNGILTGMENASDNEALRKELADIKNDRSDFWDHAALRAELAAKDARIAEGERWFDLWTKVSAACAVLRKELAEAQATSLADRKRAVDIGNALQTSLGLANKELAEAKAALEVYDRTFPKKSELELHAALKAANARIAEFADKGTLQALRDANNRAERAEAECKALREALQNIVDHRQGDEWPYSTGYVSIARAALNPEP